MSPEQCAGDRAMDGRSDLYSLGAVAYHMLTGQPPFTGGGTPAIMMKQVMERPVPVQQRRAEVPEDLARIVMRLLEKDPANRFVDGAALVAALDGAPVTPVKTPPVVRAPAEQVEPRAEWDEPRYLSRRELRQMRRARVTPQSLPERVQFVRNLAVRYATTSVGLVALNVFTGHGFWWCAFPIGWMGLRLVQRAGSLWAEGVAPDKLFSREPFVLPPASAMAGASPAAPTSPGPLSPSAIISPAPIVPALPATGPNAAALRQARQDLSNVHDLVARLSDSERKMLPEVAATARGLYARIVALAAALERLDEQIGTNRVPGLDERIAQIEQSDGETGERERRLMLLRRQRDMVADLVRQRGTLHEQFESAGLLLQNLALDVLKIRSSGLDSALGGISSVTQEARALSREIGYVLSAADELRELGP
jgi:hypothetical protein